VPYLDNDLIDLAMNLPATMKIRGGVAMHPEAGLAGLLPPDAVARQGGFSIPLKNWLLGAWNGLMHECSPRTNCAGAGCSNRRSCSG
jgi:hypothetical protein